MTTLPTNSNTLADLLGLELLEPSERIEMLNDVHDLIVKGTLVRLLERMNEKQKAGLDELMALDASEDEVQAYLEQNVPGADEAMRDTIAELQSDILAVTETK